jgi:hypothetical protein
MPASEARYRLCRACLWWVVIGIWAYVLAFAVPAFAGVRDTGSLVSAQTIAVGDYVGTLPSGASHVCTREEFADGPPVVPYLTPWSCQPASAWTGSACYWSAYVSVDGVEYAGHRSQCFVEFWSETATPPDPPASGASGAAISCGGSDCLDADTFEGWARIVAGCMVVVVWSLGLAHGRVST